MSKVRKAIRIVSIITSVLFLIIFIIYIAFIVSCVGGRFYSDGYYIYNRPMFYKQVTIVGLTDLGKEQEVLIIPKSINNYTVTSIGGTDYDYKEICRKYGERDGLFSSNKLKRLYVPFDISYSNVYVTDFFWGETKIEAFVSMGMDDIDLWKNQYLRLAKNVSGFETIQDGFKISVHMEEDGRFSKTLPANVSFLLNYEGAENDGYYWVDDCDGELIPVIPDDPIREGYTFGGWYKEAECVNEWDFATDMVPEKQYEKEKIIDDSGQEVYVISNYIYKETKLYAKWIKN